MKNLSDFYTNNYLTESAQRLPGDKGGNNTLEQHRDIDAVVEPDDLEFDLDEELQETYYAGGDEGDPRNKGVTPKIAKNKKKKTVKKEETNESFQDLYDSIMVQEMDEMDYEEDGGMDYEEDEFSDESEGETVTVNVSEVRAVIDQLEALVGGVGGYEDDMEGDVELEDDFPTESWGGGGGSKELDGDYSGKAKDDKGTTHLSGDNWNKASGKVNAKPHDEEGSHGSKELDGDYSGKAKDDKGTRHLKNGKDSNKASGKTPYKKAKKPEEDLFGK